MVNEDEQVRAVRRTVASRLVEAGEARVATISQVYDTDLEDLWDAVTTAERIPRWFLPISGDLKQGGHYQFEGNAGGTITRCDAPTSFEATWEYNNEVSWVTVRLSSEGAGRTRFELEHVAHVSAELWEQYGPSATGIGWDMGLMGLANYMSSDKRPELDPAVAAAWTVSEDGKRFMRLSADSWAEAAIAGGDDPQAARAGADRTYGAYTGG
ncbi:SRPBCC family protein [Actinoplanes sp. TFC3]|uniref:SRPBCC family protein n=1 Tax=Actinoplanes sp. TFC3 TaxID=1710355 RepID=UPI00082DF262|nr:SRPBCC family protein [Actinoplanes sp. TFC3]